jgi:hypothetical protein
VAGYVYRLPTPPYTTFITAIRNDPAVPAGYVLCTSDGAFRRPQQNYECGAASGGWPRYPVVLGETAAQTLQRINGTAPAGYGY